MPNATLASIRPFSPPDTDTLHQVFYESVHSGTTHEYTKQQREVWAPLDYDKQRWQTKMIALNPFILEYQNKIIGYADLQSSGLIDHFYILPDYHRQGFGKQLMEYIMQRAKAQNMTYLYSFVSLTAQPFFQRMGFKIEDVQQIHRGDVILNNARMGYFWDT